MLPVTPPTLKSAWSNRIPLGESFGPKKIVAPKIATLGKKICPKFSPPRGHQQGEKRKICTQKMFILGPFEALFYQIYGPSLPEEKFKVGAQPQHFQNVLLP